MNVCSLELSKQLYEVSGWEGELSLRYLTPFDDEYAVYTLGYLLRKLPEYYVIWRGVEYSHAGNISAPHYIEDMGIKADTPEDAACKLAIELFHQGILKRKGEK